jgi:gamma-D-glutamyl-L-lysine dipeptidyl-peptidase
LRSSWTYIQTLSKQDTLAHYPFSDAQPALAARLIFSKPMLQHMPENTRSVTHNVASLFAEPSSKAEVVTQALYGAELTVLNEESEMLHVRMADGYTGWIRTCHCGNIDPGIVRQAGDSARVLAPFADLFEAPEQGAEMITRLSIGSTLRIMQRENGMVRIPEGWMSEAVLILNPPACGEVRPSLLRTARSLLGTPYLWGGTSAFGIDCSGFVQLLFGLYGLPLPRDAYQQAACEAGCLADAQNVPGAPGDIVYFYGKEDPRGRGVTHVGIVLDDNSFIHAYGKMGVTISEFQNRDIMAAYPAWVTMRVPMEQPIRQPYWLS